MMRTRSDVYARFLASFVVLGALGLLGAGYVLVHQRLALPFRHVHTLRLQFRAADGLVEGIGQPVNVVGVKVGQVTHVRLADGLAVVTVELDPAQVPRVHADAKAVLEPITPLKDMQIALDPGHDSAPVLADGATLSVAQTSPPVPLADLLSTLDSDTRTYLSGLLASLDQGTAGRSADIRRMLLALGPTIGQAGELSHALADRRAKLAHFVHNLALVTAAATRDGRLADMVAAGHRTLSALAEQDRPLRDAIARLPRTLATARATLTDLRPFARTLGPTVGALLPAVRRLPATFSKVQPFADTGTRVLRDSLRPFVREANPLLRDAAPAITGLRAATPSLTSSAQTFNYFLNEFAYNPPGPDEGFLFWFSWAWHNFNSFLSASDANGNIGRATRLVDCGGLQSRPDLQAALGVAGLCPP